MASCRGDSYRIVMVALALTLACSGPFAVEPPPQDSTAAPRERMVDQQIEARGVKDPRVLAAMRVVPRHLFIPEGPARSMAYEDTPLPIGHEQTLSQPCVVAFRTE